jgi:glycosyltransferase involved in cell wall biosynthesis
VAVRGDARRHSQQSLDRGLDLVGFVFGEFGLAESMRGLAAACIERDIPFAVRDVDMRVRTRQVDRTLLMHLTRELSRRCTVFCLNPDMMQPLLPIVAASSAAGSRVVGYWYWELGVLPHEWDYALDRMDELWAGSEFVAEAMRRSTTKPVVKIPPPIELTLSRAWRRADFGLPEDRFLFLFTFDFNSYVKRKNPEGTIEAFKRACAARRDVGLVIKSMNGALQPERLRALRSRIDGDERILLKDEAMSRDEMIGLENAVDAFVSLHRAEGFGLGLAEAMYLGKPAIGTAHSGNLEFMNESNSCLVNFELVPLAEGDYLYADPRFRWAEPDVEHAAHHMRRLVDDVAFRNRIAATGRHDVRTRFTRAATAALIKQRLLELGAID